MKQEKYILSFFASAAMTDTLAEDAVSPGGGDVTDADAVVGGCVEMSNCSFSCSLKFFGFGGDRLGERRRSRLLCLPCRRACLSRL